MSIPGSTAAVKLTIKQLILPELVHLVSQLERRSTNNQELDIPLSMSAEMPLFGHDLDY